MTNEAKDGGAVTRALAEAVFQAIEWFDDARARERPIPTHAITYDLLKKAAKAYEAQP